MTIETLIQQPDRGARVDLYELDLTPLDVATVLRFTNSSLDDDGSPIIFGGETYTQAAIEMLGLVKSADGDIPEPTLSVANTNGAISALVSQYDDLVGCKITRIRTYEIYLDGKPAADPTAVIDRLTFVIEQKRDINNAFATFALAPLANLVERKFPRGVCLKGTCTQRYRTYSGSAFNYTKATCPYIGNAYFKADGTSTANASEDQCGKRLSDCIARFGSQPLPTWAFPGMTRV